MSKQNNKQHITTLDRLISAFVHGVISLIFFGALQTFLVLKSLKSADFTEAILSKPYFIYAVVVFSVIAFIVGPKKMAHFWGMIFGTNRKHL